MSSIFSTYLIRKIRIVYISARMLYVIIEQLIVIIYHDKIIKLYIYILYLIKVIKIIKIIK